MDLQEQLELGNQAEEFLKYVTDHPYFQGLIERMKLEYARQILDLPAENIELFRGFRYRMSGVDDVMNAVRGDIYLGSDALKKLNGEPETGGLL